MILEVGEKLHIVYRALHEEEARRHIVGQVKAVDGAICRLLGYVFIYDRKSTMFVRKSNPRTTIINVSESGYIVNVINPETNLSAVEYKYTTQDGVICTDGHGFSMNVNEFGPRS